MNDRQDKEIDTQPAIEEQAHALAIKHANVLLFDKLVVEAALLCASHPMSAVECRQLFDHTADDDIYSKTYLIQVLESIQQDWIDRGMELVELASGWRFQSRAWLQRYLERLNPERVPKYSRAVMETLSIIAWRQPVTRGDIEDIRGVTVSTQIIRTLEDRGWIEVIGHRDGPGRPGLFGTTKQFLDDLGLRALDELPALDVAVHHLHPDECATHPLAGLLNTTSPELDFSEPQHIDEQHIDDTKHAENMTNLSNLEIK